MGQKFHTEQDLSHSEVRVSFSLARGARSLDLVWLIYLLSNRYISFLQVHPCVSCCMELKMTKSYYKGHQMFKGPRSFSSRQALSIIQNSKETYKGQRTQADIVLSDITSKKKATLYKPQSIFAIKCLVSINIVLTYCLFFQSQKHFILFSLFFKNL